MSVLEGGRDTFYAFYTDGVLRDVDGTARLDDTGRPIHDGWVTAIGPMVVAEVGADIFRATGGLGGATLTLESTAGWSVLTALSQDVSWIIMEAGKLTVPSAWRILAETQQDVGWGIAWALSQDAAWRIRRSIPTETGWTIRSHLEGATAWQVLTETGPVRIERVVISTKAVSITIK